MFETSDKEIRLNVKVDHDTVWLNRNQMSELFGRDVKTIGKHTNNAINEELSDQVVVAKFATTTQHGAIEGKTQTHMTEYYNLDVVISVGYRAKSKRDIEFRRWANKVLKEYIIKGYALYDKRLQVLQKTVEIQTKMLANTMDIEQDEVLKAVNLYTQALQLLDRYDHQTLTKPEGNQPIYRITYDDCRRMVSHMEDSFKSDVFGVEKEPGKVEGMGAELEVPLPLCLQSDHGIKDTMFFFVYDFIKYLMLSHLYFQTLFR